MSVTLDKPARHLVLSHREEIINHLPRPDTVWQWSECQLSQSLLERLRRSEYIVQDRETGDWVTTERFWTGVIALLGVREDGIGVTMGQEHLLPPNEFERLQSPIRDTQLRRSRLRDPTVQQSLTGDTVPERQENHVEQNYRKQNEGGRSTVDIDEYQTTLDVWCVKDHMVEEPLRPPVES